MAHSTRFAKPNMANLLAELGRAIIEQILNTPKPDDGALEKEANLFEKKMDKEPLQSDLFCCGHLGTFENDEHDIVNFTVRDEKGNGLLEYIKHYAFFFLTV